MDSKSTLEAVTATSVVGVGCPLGVSADTTRGRLNDAENPHGSADEKVERFPVMLIIKAWRRDPLSEGLQCSIPGSLPHAVVGSNHSIRAVGAMHPFPLVTTRMMPFAVILDPVHWHVHCGLDGACLTKDHLALLGSIGIRNGRIVFFP
jgi:hypothetical protein